MTHAQPPQHQPSHISFTKKLPRPIFHFVIVVHETNSRILHSKCQRSATNNNAFIFIERNKINYLLSTFALRIERIVLHVTMHFMSAYGVTNLLKAQFRGKAC